MHSSIFVDIYKWSSWGKLAFDSGNGYCVKLDEIASEIERGNLNNKKELAIKVDMILSLKDEIEKIKRLNDFFAEIITFWRLLKYGFNEIKIVSEARSKTVDLIARKNDGEKYFEVKRLNLPIIDSKICGQNRLGNSEWIYFDEEHGSYNYENFIAGISRKLIYFCKEAEVKFLTYPSNFSNQFLIVYFERGIDGMLAIDGDSGFCPFLGVKVREIAAGFKFNLDVREFTESLSVC